jgi:uncharacterized MAPEG superfamily protein
MTIAEWSVLAAILIYIGTIGIPKWTGRGRFDNDNPRNPAFYREAFRARALGAHQNGIEAVPFFAFAVLLAEFRHVPQGHLDALALAFLVLRLAYVFLYLKGWGSLRSTTWLLGFGVNIAIFLMPLWALPTA